MADKQIGIKLDVKSTGLKQVDDALDSVSKNLKGLNEKVMENQQKGWGSESQTKELREQLRSMQQLLQLTERMARTKGVHSESFGQQSREISSMQRDLSDVRTYRNPISGRIHDRLGPAAAGGFDKAATWGGRAATGLVAFDFLSTMRSGLSTGTQMSYGYGDLAKRMAPGMNSQKYGMNMSKSMQGYGYTDNDLLQSATSYGAATGRMDSGKFSSQMQAIEQTGRNYGLDLGSVTENFASMYKGGVTGGSKEQMNPQEYANLVANAVNRGNMQGKEMQVIGQIQQLVQMGVSSSGQSGDANTLAAFLAMGNKSGNQAFSNNLPQYLSSMNSGMMSPGGGYAGQSLMMQAIGGKDMGYYETQVQAAKGAFGVNEKNGKTNIENVMTHLSKSFDSKDIDQKAVMFSTLFPGMNAAQSKEFIQNYTNDDGSFKQGGMDELKKQMKQQAASIPQNETDAARNRTTYKEHSANEVGQETTSGRSYIDAVQGGLINSAGAPLVYGAEGLMAANTAYGAYKFGKGIYNFGKNRFGGGPTIPGGPGSAIPLEGPSTIPTNGPGKVIPFPNKNPLISRWGPRLALGVETLGTSIAGGYMNDKINEVNTPENRDRVSKLINEGSSSVNGKQIKDMGYFEYLGQVVKSIWNNQKKMNSPSSGNGTSEARMQADAQEQFQVGRSQSASSSVPLSGTSLAPIVASTIVALGPYMSQLKSIIGGTDDKSGKSLSDLVYRGQDGGSRDLMLRSNDATSGGLRLASNSSGSSNRPMRSVKTGQTVNEGSTSFSGSVSDFVQSMLPYAQQASAKTGLPEEFILGQWGHESGWGKETNDSGGPSVSKMNNNFAGIKPWHNSKGGADAGANSMYAGYASKSDFADGYASFLNSNGRYEKLLEAGKKGASDEDLVKIMGNTGYAEDGNYTNALNGAVNSAKQAIKVSGEVTITVNQPDGSTTTQKAPITAEFTGISA